MADSGVIEAGRLRLVPFAEEHLTERYLGWLRDQALLRFSEQRFRRHTLASCREYRASFQGSPNHFWAVEETGQGLGHVGTMTAYVDERNGVADLGILLGAAEARGRGLALEAWQAACRFLLARGVRKITAGALSVNAAMLRVMEKAGMVPDGVRRGQVLFEGRAVDVVHMAMFAPPPASADQQRDG